MNLFCVTQTIVCYHKVLRSAQGVITRILYSAKYLISWKIKVVYTKHANITIIFVSFTTKAGHG